jgi:putative glycerol-1-phosphate prenyltransferase
METLFTKKVSIGFFNRVFQSHNFLSFVSRKMKGKFVEHLRLFKQQKTCGFSVLVDPDSVTPEEMAGLAKLCNDSKVDFLLLGGSLLLSNHVENCIEVFKKETGIPVVLFPGSPEQVTPMADALLYLSLISGRNPEYLIGQHVVSAPKVKASGLEIISTGYILVDGGKPTTVSYMSHTNPIPANKPDIALCTAWAGEMLGNQAIYLDAGSGARNPVSEEMIEKLSSNLSVPLIVGGGIQTPEKVYLNGKAGANLVIVGNAIEKDSLLIKEMAQASKQVFASVTK